MALKAYKHWKCNTKVGEDKKGKPKYILVDRKDEVKLSNLVNFEFNTNNLRELRKDLNNLGFAVEMILLADPDKFKKYFEAIVSQKNTDSEWYEDPEKIVLENE